MSRRAPAAVVSLVACTVLTGGCGAAGAPAGGPRPAPGSSTAPPTTAATAAPSPPPVSASPAHGAEVDGEGYSFRVPRGWRDVTGTLSDGQGVDRAAGARHAQHGFNSNVNVVATRGALSPSQVRVATRFIRERIRATAPSYAVLRPVLVAGEPAGHLAGLRSGAKPPYWLEQYVVSHGAHAYVVSFSFSPRVPAAQRRHTIGSVLASWAWR